MGMSLWSRIWASFSVLMPWLSVKRLGTWKRTRVDPASLWSAATSSDVLVWPSTSKSPQTRMLRPSSIAACNCSTAWATPMSRVGGAGV